MKLPVAGTGAGRAPEVDVEAARRALAGLAWDCAYAQLADDAPAHTLGVRQRQEPLREARLLAWSEEAARLVGLGGLSPAARASLVPFVNGERPLPAGDPVAMAYAGHQFGVWVPRLGDGRALLLGEVTGPDGTSWDLHAKGTGPTPYARFGDGRCVLRAAIRELVACEALAALGVPTTRGLLVITSDTPVVREKTEPGAIVVRLAPSHVRFGSFELLATTRPELVPVLADHVIARDLPHLAGAPDRHRRLLEEAVVRTGRLFADWHALGFVHGVLNTDNLSILGLTLDYGPYAFVEAFEPSFVPNHSDHEGRYAWDRQPEIGLWGLSRLALALKSLVPLEQAEGILEGYAAAFEARYTERMAGRLGLRAWSGEADGALLDDWFALLHDQGVDYPLAFRRLSSWSPGAANARVRELFVDPRPFDAWAERWWSRATRDGDDAAAIRGRLDAANPRIVARTWHLQRAIEAAEKGDGSVVAALLEAVRRPFDDDPALDAWAAPPPRDAPACVLSCSS